MRKLMCIVCSLFTFCGCMAKEAPQTINLYFISDPSATRPASHKFKVSLAVNNKQWMQGLMYKKDSDLAEHQGMLFIFPNEEPRTFWMRNTYLSLDIIFIDADKTVVSLIEEATPLSEAPLPSGYPAKYVVEIRGGLAKKLGITRGSKVKFDVPAKLYQKI